VTDDTETDEWNVDEKMLQEMKESYRQVRRKDRKSPGAHITISDSECWDSTIDSGCYPPPAPLKLQPNGTRRL